MEAGKNRRKLHSYGTVKTKINLDSNAERNAAFYKLDGFINCYPKSQVYPVEGGEVSLEQLKARLPQYKYCPPVQTEMCCDDFMEMTTCINNTIHPGLSNKENASVTVTKILNPPKSNRQPLQAVTRDTSLSPDKKIDSQLRGDRGGDGNGEIIGELLDDMVLQQSAEREIERRKQTNKLVTQIRGCNGSDSGDDGSRALLAKANPLGDEDLGSLVNQENLCNFGNKPPPAPAPTMASKGCATRLNFSDAENSLGASQLNSVAEDSGWRLSLLGQSQVLALERSGAGGQSFEVFHDSWTGQAHNISHGRPLQPVPDIQLPVPGARYFGKPLEIKYQQEAPPESDMSSFAESYNQSHSYQAGASKSNMSSFSVYEDSIERSSLAPFHDSWVDTSKKDINRQPGSTNYSANMQSAVTGQETVSECQSKQPDNREDVAVHDEVLGAPLEGGGDGVGGGANTSAVDQSFYTQVGICHPKVAPSISTPVNKKIDLTFDMSRIQPDSEFLSHPPDHPQPPFSSLLSATQRKRSCSAAPCNLSTIKEESSSSLKSSRSSACTTGTNSSSSCSHESLGGSHISPADLNVNPFSSEIVNMMLNSLRASVVDSVCSMPGGLPQLVSGHSVLLGGEEYTALKKVTAGGFGTIYTCKHGEETRVLKVQKPALKWEIAIISELHTRMKVSNLTCMLNSFVKIERSCIFANASVMVLPHYKHGSLLDLANVLDDRTIFPLYYIAEVLEIVANLHHCDILHTDIKPDNFMLADISMHKRFASAHGHGLVLIDFGRAVDLKAFSGDVLFQGSCETEGFQCTQMLEGKPWKYEADYFGIAATAHVLLTGQYMSVVKDAQTNLFELQKPLRRSQHSSLWSTFFSCLLNTTKPLPLSEMAAEMTAKLDGVRDYMFHALCKKMFAAVEKQLRQR